MRDVLDPRRHLALAASRAPGGEETVQRFDGVLHDEGGRVADACQHAKDETTDRQFPLAPLAEIPVSAA